MDFRATNEDDTCPDFCENETFDVD